MRLSAAGPAGRCLPPAPTISGAASHCCSADMSAPAQRRKQALQAFGRKWQLPEFLAGTIEIVGIRIPTAGIIVVAALTLVAMTIWGIIVSRAPRNITQQVT